MSRAPPVAARRPQGPHVLALLRLRRHPSRKHPFLGFSPRSCSWSPRRRPSGARPAPARTARARTALAGKASAAGTAAARATSTWALPADPQSNCEWWLAGSYTDEGVVHHGTSAAGSLAADPGRRRDGRVVDTGVEPDHPDLLPNLLNAQGYNFWNHTVSRLGRVRPGTLVAGILAAAAGNGGYVGVAPMAKILPVKIMGPHGDFSERAAVAGTMFAIRSGARVLNLSWGGYQVSIGGMQAALAAAARRDKLVVIAAGNNGADLDGGAESPDSAGYRTSITVANLTWLNRARPGLQLRPLPRPDRRPGLGDRGRLPEPLVRRRLRHLVRGTPGLRRGGAALQRVPERDRGSGPPRHARRRAEAAPAPWQGRMRVPAGRARRAGRDGDPGRSPTVGVQGDDRPAPEPPQPALDGRARCRARGVQADRGRKHASGLPALEAQRDAAAPGQEAHMEARRVRPLRQRDAGYAPLGPSASIQSRFRPQSVRARAGAT